TDSGHAKGVAIAADYTENCRSMVSPSTLRSRNSTNQPGLILNRVFVAKPPSSFGVDNAYTTALSTFFRPRALHTNTTLCRVVQVKLFCCEVSCRADGTGGYTVFYLDTVIDYRELCPRLDVGSLNKFNTSELTNQ